MKRIVLKYGLVSGALIAAFGAVMLPICMRGGFEHTEVIGYSAMVLAFLFVFFGIRSYREKLGGGAITFGRAFTVGILITLVTSTVYVVAWEIVYWGFMPDFGDKYAALQLEKMKAKGASDAELVAAKAQMEQFKRLYKNPLFNVGMTYLEIFPVGLIVTLVSAGILRRKGPPGTASPAAATA